jgi:hypothetical protein
VVQFHILEVRHLLGRNVRYKHTPNTANNKSPNGK